MAAAIALDYMTGIEKYEKRATASNSLVCVGLDPDFEKIPEEFKTKEFPQFEFCKYIIDRTHKYVSAYKPNMAFFEARGSRGVHELELTAAYLLENHPDIFTICDAKRGDIGNTNEQYAKEILDTFKFDAITVHPYMGSESLASLLERKDKVIVVLCRTSNSGAREFQDRLIDGKPLWHVVAEEVRDTWNKNGNCMLVAGATYPGELKKIREMVGNMTLLVPGIGSQGGDLEAALKAGLTNERRGLMINSSRGIIFSSDPEAAARDLRDQINQVRNGNV